LVHNGQHYDSSMSDGFFDELNNVKAGLCSFDRTMPEEINRVITDHISNIIFCHTETAVKNLKSEGTAFIKWAN